MNPASLIDYWYSPATRKRWFKSTQEFDQTLHQQYHAWWQTAVDGELDSWLEDSRGCLGLSILLDQIPRNIFRGTANAFASDQQAVTVCKHAIDSRLHLQLNTDESRFLYMPLMHSESLVDQYLSVQMFAVAGLKEQSAFAHHHLDIVQRFGRFPHRNELLGRESAPDELAYLQSKEAFRG